MPRHANANVSALTVGKAVFAVRVVDKANPNNFVVSPIVAVEQTMEGIEQDRKEQSERARARRISMMEAGRGRRQSLGTARASS